MTYWKRVAVALVLGGAFLSCGQQPSIESPNPPMSPSTWDPARLDAAFEMAVHYGSTTLLIMTDGRIVRSLGDLSRPYPVHSVRKALLSALVGQHLGVGPGKIDLNASLADLGVDDHPRPLLPLQKQATVLHLIKSVSGINHPAAGEIDSMVAAKQRRLGKDPNPPGRIWAYNNWDYNALTTVFEQATGLSVYAAFAAGIARPLGMLDFDRSSVFYVRAPQHSIHPKAGFKLSARDMARFGQLYLNRGYWQGRQLIPASWTDRVTADYAITGERGISSGHGYLWWVPWDQRSRAMGIPAGTFVASGFAGQRIVVIPAWNTVIVHQVDTRAYKGYCRQVARTHRWDFSQAVAYSRAHCRQTEHLEEAFCKQCRFISGNDFHHLLAHIMKARK